MTYPEKTILTRTFRVFLMLGLILTFSIISPAIILYTSGYRFDWQEWRIVQTGVISIDATPHYASVSLNDTQIKQSLPMRLTNRAPGTYRLKISAPGYLNWEKDILVGSNLTTYVKQITLFKSALPALLLAEEKTNISTIYPSPDGQWILYAQFNRGTNEINLLNTASEKITPMVRIKNFKSIFVSWSADSRNAIISMEGDDKNTVYIFSTADAANIVTWEFPAKKMEFAWNEDRPASGIYTKINNKINLISLNANEEVFSTPTSSKAWCIDDNNVLWLYDKPSKKIFSSNVPSLEVPFTDDEEIIAIIYCRQNRLFAKNTDTIFSILLGETPNPLTEIKSSNVIFNPSTNEWLSWSESELWSIYANNRAALLERNGEKINSIIPLDAYGVLLIESKNSLVAFNPGYNVRQTLFNNGKIEKTTINQKLRKIFFLGTVGQKRGIYELSY